MKKITILALHLNYGGIERFITNLANSLSDNYEIEIVSTYKILDKPFFRLNNNVKVKYLTELKPNRDVLKRKLKRFNLFGFIKELIKSIMKNKLSLCSFQTQEFFNNFEMNIEPKPDSVLRVFLSIKKLDYLVAVSNKMYEDYKAYSNIPVIYIPNSIESMPKTVSKLNTENIITVGRLEKVKGFEDLIDIFKIIISKNEKIHLNIVGAGSDYDSLNSKIIKLKLQRNVKLLGYKTEEELDDLYNDSSLYVMTSFSESFGLVLLEAMSHKLPCIAFDSANGAKEIIKNGENGYLIGARDKEKMANKILNLINSKQELEYLGNNALNNSKEYLSKNIKQKWVDIFEK